MWYVYIVKCNDGTFYTGITNDLSKRIATHNKGQGAKYTAGRTPVKLVWSQGCINHSIAARWESQIKKSSRKKKLDLIKGM